MSTSATDKVTVFNGKQYVLDTEPCNGLVLKKHKCAAIAAVKYTSGNRLGAVGAFFWADTDHTLLLLCVDSASGLKSFRCTAWALNRDGRQRTRITRIENLKKIIRI